MKYKLVFLKKEADINKVLNFVTHMKETRQYKNDKLFLFVSLWDKWCKELLAKLKDGDTPENAEKTVYIINSFDMPHAFMIFNTKITPTLVKILNKKVISVDRLPSIHEEFWPTNKKSARS